LDLQVVENVPREHLIALCRRKDKEAKIAAAKLEKLEDRTVKLVRFNKLLAEDRSSFQRFCSEVLPDSAGIFEEAAAQETSVNLDALRRGLSDWRGALESSSEDRKIFKQFVELVFPGDMEVERLFAGEALGPGAFDMLQYRWTQLEDLHNQSIASVNAMARDQMMARMGEFEAALQGQKEAERKAEELRAQLTELHREKAQMLKQKFHGRGEAEASNGAAPVGAAADLQQSRENELRKALEASERRERETRESSMRREQDSQAMLAAETAEVQRLKRELEHAMEDGERQRTQVRQLAEEKDAVVGRLRGRVDELEQELGSNAFIAQAAEQQASRDAEVKAKERQVDHLSQMLEETRRQLQLSYTQERVLKDRIRELEGTHCRGHVASDYLKHVVMKYMEYTQVGDLKAQGLVPVLCTLLSLTPDERRIVENPGMPQPWLVLNQAVGGASTWLRGGAVGPRRSDVVEDPAAD